MQEEQIFILAVGVLNIDKTIDLTPLKRVRPQIQGMVGSIGAILATNPHRDLYKLFITHQGDDYNRTWYDRIKELDTDIFQAYCVGITKLNILDVFGGENRSEILSNYNIYSKS